MAGKIRNLLNRDGRYFARLTVPKELRAIVGKREPRTPLGPDRKRALRRHPLALAKLLDVLADARRSVEGSPTSRRVLSEVELAHLHYEETLEKR